MSPSTRGNIAVIYLRSSIAPMDQEEGIAAVLLGSGMCRYVVALPLKVEPAGSASITHNKARYEDNYDEVHLVS
jgi:hypothetical protein